MDSKKVENLDVDNTQLKSIAPPSNEEIIYIKGNEFLKGNIEEVWESRFPQVDIIDYSRNDEDKTYKFATYCSPCKEEPLAIVIYLHGMGGYMRLSSYLAKQLNKKNVSVYGYDYRGHGQSEGKRGYFTDVEDLVNDTIVFIKKVRERHPSIPFFIGGSSLGGNIAYKISSRYPGFYKGVFLYAPALKPIQGCCTYYTAVCMGSLFPCCGIDISDPTSSTKSAYGIEKMHDDPYFAKGKTPFASIKAVLVGMKGLEETFPDYKENFIVFMGGNEQIVNTEAILNLFKQSSSKNKRMYHYERMYHNILMEDECFDVISKTVDWLVSSI